MIELLERKETKIFNVKESKEDVLLEYKIKYTGKIGSFDCEQRLTIHTNVFGDKILEHNGNLFVKSLKEIVDFCETLK